ncbi:MAG: hypothetical protein OD817_06660 [Gammaproteobacteria bacterium]
MLNHELNLACDEVWNYLKDSVRFGISQGEETLTDNLLLYLARNKKKFSKIKIAGTKKATKQQESRTGIDWEWWIGRDRRWLRYAVQAKKLCQEKEHYAKLRHKVGRARSPHANYQHEILRKYAAKCKAIPIYAFYNYVHRDSYNNYWHCCESQSVSKLGITVTPLGNISFASHPPGYSKFDVIHGYCSTVPMRCLACPNICMASMRMASRSYSRVHSWAEVVASAKVYEQPKCFLSEQNEHSDEESELPYVAKRTLIITTNEP